MKKYHFEMNMLLLNILCSVITIILFILMLMRNNYEVNISYNIVIIYIFWMLLHELLHGIGFAINKEVNNKNIKYGIALEKGVMYTLCKQIISKKSILISLMFPFTFIGIITLIIGIIINNNNLEMLSILNIAGSIGDVVMFLNLIKIKDFKYYDNKDITGFNIISEEKLENNKYLGLKLIEYKDIKNIQSVDITKINKKYEISKTSILMLVILLIIQTIISTIN